jgi:RimJ/RimL family protein N-acetyltransferase
MNSIFETERLILREFNIHDSKFIIELLNSPGWLKFIGDRNIKTEEDARVYLQNGPLKSYEINGYGLSLVVLKGTQTPIGMCGIINRSDLDHPDIGFAFLPEFTGKGYAYEIANATMIHAKDVLKIPTILGITVAYNKSSIALLNKIGLKFKHTFFMPDDKEELMLFSN